MKSWNGAIGASSRRSGPSRAWSNHKRGRHLARCPGHAHSDQPRRDPGRFTLTEAEFTEQANVICLSADARIGEILGPIVSGAPTPDELQVALDAIVSTSRETSDNLADLSPPSEMSGDVDDMLTAFNAANDEAEAQGLGFFETDGDPWAPAGTIAANLGLDDCAND